MSTEFHAGAERLGRPIRMTPRPPDRRRGTPSMCERDRPRASCGHDRPTTLHTRIGGGHDGLPPHPLLAMGMPVWLPLLKAWNPANREPGPISSAGTTASSMPPASFSGAGPRDVIPRARADSIPRGRGTLCYLPNHLLLPRSHPSRWLGRTRCTAVQFRGGRSTHHAPGTGCHPPSPPEADLLATPRP